MKCSCVDIWTLLLSFLLPFSGTGQFTIIGPTQPLIAHVGKEIVFSCHLNPSMDAQGMEVRWFRDQIPFVVHMYQDGQDHVELQNKEYHGRTEFLRANITQGIVALRLRDIHPLDEGHYGCMIRTLTFYNEARFLLQVAGVGSTPHIHLESGEVHGIQLLCTSSGWYPEPEVRWTAPGGRHLLPFSEIKQQKANGLFHVETAIFVWTHTEGNVSCFICNPILDMEKEARISVADDLFPRGTVWKTSFSVAVALLLIFLLGAALFAWIQHRTNRKLHEDLEKQKLLGEGGMKTARRYAVDVTLDIDTAHPYLQITEDKKSVKGGDVFQKLSKCKQRFDNLVCVLGEQIFSKGKHYWEVSVKEKIKWTLGVCSDSVCRQGEIQVSPEFGFWTICLNRSNDYQALANPHVTLQLEESPEIIGIFLDYEAGRVSFYNVTNLTHMYTYQKHFREDLRPYFYPGPLRGGLNGQPLTILPLGHIEQATEENDCGTEEHSSCFKFAVI